MTNSSMQLIRNRIEKLPYGSSFVVADFTDLTDYENAKKCLLRLEKDSIIRRVIRGIYDKPYFSRAINEYASPDIQEIAQAIARNYNWKIAPTGLTSLNLLGLSTQVINVYEYYSSGQYKTYQIGNIKISFKHKSSKELLDLSYHSLLVIQAIKEIGQDINEEQLSLIRQRLTAKEKEILFKESSYVTKWVFEKIKDVCSMEEKCIK